MILFSVEIDGKLIPINKSHIIPAFFVNQPADLVQVYEKEQVHLCNNKLFAYSRMHPTNITSRNCNSCQC